MADSSFNTLGTLLGTLGTIVLSNMGPGRIVGVAFGGTYVGSVELYDSPTVAGTAAGNLIYNVGLPLLNQYKDVHLDAPFKNGLVSVATGTPILYVTWSK